MHVRQSSCSGGAYILFGVESQAIDRNKPENYQVMISTMKRMRQGAGLASERVVVFDYRVRAAW